MKYIKTILILFLVMSFPYSTFGACTGGGTSCTKSGTTYTCTDASYGCINDAVTAATAGDTINITAQGSVNWTTRLQLSKKLNLIGLGSANLRITWSTGGSESAILIYNAAARVSGFEFYTTSSQTAIDVQGYSSTANEYWRIDHCKYTNTVTTASGPMVRIDSEATGQTIKGLVDNNDIHEGRILLNNTSVGYVLGGLTWSTAVNPGSDEAIYVEDNTFTTARNPALTPPNATDMSRGAKIVFRYNTVNGQYSEVHPSFNYGRGQRWWEFYGNTYKSLGAGYKNGIYGRSGTGIILYNDFTSDVPYTHDVYFDEDRNTGDPADNTTPAGKCDGNNNLDGNADATGYPCRDQVGRGTDASRWVDVNGNPTAYVANLARPGPVQALTPVYLVNNRTTSGGLVTAGVAAESADHIKANRDYYEQGASFNGTSGVGCGTLASRPATCTTGVGYWATTQSCSNLTGMVGANPSTPISGTLYKCTAPNIWTTYYTPYTYPHPLRQADGGATPSAPRNLKIVN